MGATPSREQSRPIRPPLGSRPQHGRHGGMTQQPPAPADAETLSVVLDSSAIRGDWGTRQYFGRADEQLNNVQQRAVVPNAINVKMSTVTLNRAEENSSVHVLEFVFDATVCGFVAIYYAATPSFDTERGSALFAPVKKLSYMGKGNRRPAKTPFKPGSAQRYRQKLERGLDVRQYDEQELFGGQEVGRASVVILLEAQYPENTQTPAASRVQAQATMVGLELLDDGRLTCHVLGQDVLIDGTVYRIRELYGIAGEVRAQRPSVSGGAATGYDGEREKKPSPDAEISDQLDISTSECVICLTEPSLVALIPCNHLCICVECWEKLHYAPDRNKRKCPICRTSFNTGIRILRKFTESAGKSIENTSHTGDSTESPVEDVSIDGTHEGFSALNDPKGTKRTSRSPFSNEKRKFGGLQRIHPSAASSELSARGHSSSATESLPLNYDHRNTAVDGNDGVILPSAPDKAIQR